MINVIKEMRAEMIIGAKTAQYGIEATLPKAAGGVSDPIMLEAIRRSKTIKHVAEYEKRLIEVQNLVDKDSSDREVQVLNWMLDGRLKTVDRANYGLSHTHKTYDGVIEGVLICAFYASMVSIKNSVISVFSAFVLASQKSLIGLSSSLSHKYTSVPILYTSMSISSSLGGKVSTPCIGMTSF
ncbi:hypothetical protein [Lysinibacillus xylanilyticus]|uniref:hypothetical protein n=1 Tax=Lysinibacillus xylanilyticus TaxID=582475 RepID=UPI003807B28C